MMNIINIIIYMKQTYYKVTEIIISPINILMLQMTLTIIGSMDIDSQFTINIEEK